MNLTETIVTELRDKNGALTTADCQNPAHVTPGEGCRIGWFALDSGR